MVFSSGSANRTKAPKGAAAAQHLALLFAKFTTECATSLLQCEGSLTHSSAKTHSTNRALKALAIPYQCSPRSWCFAMNTMIRKQKPRRNNKATNSLCLASWRKIKCKPRRAAGFNWHTRVDNWKAPWGSYSSTCSAALDKQHMHLLRRC